MCFNELLIIAGALEGFSGENIRFWIRDAHYNLITEIWTVTVQVNGSEEEKSALPVLIQYLTSEYRIEDKEVTIFSVKDNSTDKEGALHTFDISLSIKDKVKN